MGQKLLFQGETPQNNKTFREAKTWLIVSFLLACDFAASLPNPSLWRECQDRSVRTNMPLLGTPQLLRQGQIWGATLPLSMALVPGLPSCCLPCHFIIMKTLPRKKKKRCPQMFSCWRSSPIWSAEVLGVWKCKSKCWLQGGHHFGGGMDKSQVLAWGFVQIQGWRQLAMVTELGCRSSSLLRRSTARWMRRLLWVCGLGVWIWQKGYKSGTHISGNYLIALWNTDGRIKRNNIR